MLKICLCDCSFCALLWHSILFPEDAKNWMPGIIPFNKCVYNFYNFEAVCSVFVDMKDHQMVQSAVRSGRTEVRSYSFQGRKWSLTDCICSRNDKEIFCQHNDLGHKSLRWRTSAEGLYPRVPQSPLLVGKVKTIPVYFWIRSSLLVR